MPVFRFEAMDQAGRSESGVIEADSQRHARVLLRLRLLMPLSVKPQKDEAQSQRRSFFQKGLYSNFIGSIQNTSQVSPF